MFWNSPRRPVASSIRGPMYSVGVMTCAATHGSLMASISPTFGICAGLSISTWSSRWWSLTWYSTDGAEAMRSRSNSRSSRS
jgi:hypothetical protein